MAIRLPQEVTRLLASFQQRLDRGYKEVSWVRPESIHLTLKFLGEIDDKKAADVSTALEKAAAGISPFSLTVEGVGGFPNPKAPRVVWAGVRENPELKRLQANVEDRLFEAGFERDEREFSPHLTLCRVKSAPDGRAMAMVLSRERFEEKAEFSASSFVFFKSVLKPKGAEYTALKEITLKG